MSLHWGLRGDLLKNFRKYEYTQDKLRKITATILYR